LLAAVLAAGILFTVLAAGCSPRGDEKAFHQAEDALGRGEYLEAAALYRSFITNYPDSPLAPEGQYKISYIYSRHVRDLKKAMDAYSMLFYLYPESPQAVTAREDRAELFSSRKEYRKAIADYAWLLENGPPEKNDLYRYNIAMEYIKMNDFRQARIELEELLKNIPSTPLAPQVYYQIATTHYLEGNLEEAVKGYDTVISKFPDNPICIEARLGKATALEEAGSLTEALALLEELKDEYSNTDVVKIRIKSTRERLKKEPRLRKR